MTYGITNNHEHPDDSDSSQKTKEQWLNEGSIHYRAKRYSEALITCERAIKIDKNFVRAHFAKGLVLIGLKRYEEATEALKQAAQLNPKNARLCLAIGNALYEFEHFEEAGAAYRQAIQLDPGQGIVYTEQSNALVEKASNLYNKFAYSTLSYEEVLAAYKKALLFNPSNANAYIGQARILNTIERYEEAGAAFRQAIQLDSSKTEAYSEQVKIILAKGKAYYDRGCYVEAILSYEQAILFDPGIVSAYVDMSGILYKLQRYEEAGATYRHAAHRGPRDLQPSINQRQTPVNKPKTLYERVRFNQTLTTLTY